MKILLPVLGLAALLTGCAHVNETYLPDGRKGHIIQCSNAQSMGECYKAAANVCKEQGYQIIYQKNDVLGQGHYSSGSSLAYGAASFFSNNNSAYGSGSYNGGSNWFGSSAPVTERDLIIVCGAPKDKNGKIISATEHMNSTNPKLKQQNSEKNKKEDLNQKYEDFKNGR